MPILDKPALGECRVNLYPYQWEAIDAARAEFAKGIRRTMIVLFTGAGKCVSPETLVWSGGLRGFGESWGSSRIQGPSGIADVAGWYDDGVRLGLKASLACGLNIDGTASHRVWIRDNFGIERWKEIVDLQVGDHVAVARGQADFGSDSLSSQDAYLLGLLVADGCLASGTSWRLQIDKQRPVIEAILPTLRTWKSRSGGNESEPRIYVASDSHSYAYIHSVGLPGFLLGEFGLKFPVYSEGREVPGRVLTGDRETVRAFLRGYFDGDGYCSPGVECSTASDKLASQIHQLLLGLGVFASRRLKEVQNGQPAHIIRVHDSVAFAKEVGFTKYGLTKDAAFDRLLSKDRNTNIDIIPGVGRLLQRAAGHVPGKYKRNDGWAHVGPYYDGTKKPSYEFVRSLIPAIPEGTLERSELEDIVNSNRIWSPVRAMEPSEIRRIDCEVSEQHAFIGNGIVNHNTIVAGMIARRAVEKGKRVLFLAHTEELINQAASKLDILGVDVGIEKAELRARAIFEPDVVVASVQTFWRTERLLQWERNYFDIIIYDECHHALADCNRRIIDHFSKALLLGLTATSKRADGEDLGQLFESVAFERTLDFAWDDTPPGPYASDIVTIQRDLGIDLRDLRAKKDDFNDAVLEARITPHIEMLANLGKVEIGDRSALAFTPQVKSAQGIATGMQSLGVKAEWTSGDDPHCKEKIKKYQEGEIQVLCSCTKLSEGFDAPRTSAILMYRPTKSEALYRQIAGRGVRLYPGKENCFLIDPGFLADEHELVSATCLCDHPGMDSEIIDIADAIIKKNPELTLKNAIDRAKDTHQERTILRIKAKEREIRARRVSYSMKDVYRAVDLPWRGERPSVEQIVPASERQKEFLKQMGIEDTEGMSKTRATTLLDFLKDRKSKGLATHKQVAWAIARGVDPKVARAMTIAEASETLEKLFSRTG